MKKGNKVKEFVKEHRKAIERTGVMMAGVAVGYAVGFKHCDYKTAMGLDSMFVANPGLYDTLNDAIDVTRKAMKQ